MLFKTHLAFGFLVWLLIRPYFSINKYLLLAVVLLASVLPDIDKSNSKVGSKIKPISFLIEKIFGHRKLFHSLFLWGIISVFVWYFLDKGYAGAILIGTTSHLIADGLTKQGVNFLYPVSQFRIAGFIETGSLFEIIFLMLVLGLIVIAFLF
ncbi:hypothetical protein CMO89_03115 [Candidatus Woesearchaeota archaeon]|mgnify:CR=1 FL=1|nr:hypothetical protein [Candidatus Woesearchaeota archaeon]|tara:strand:+ start:11259 stop:11714 length:456 start_codon:yes stop_codon:yes gene_type:complete